MITTWADDSNSELELRWVDDLRGLVDQGDIINPAIGRDDTPGEPACLRGITHQERQLNVLPKRGQRLRQVDGIRTGADLLGRDAAEVESHGNLAGGLSKYRMTSQVRIQGMIESFKLRSILGIPLENGAWRTVAV